MLVKSLEKTFNIYTYHGFIVSTALMHREFVCLNDVITGVKINTTTVDEHVPEIDRQIRLVKERVRAIRSTLPFKKLPSRMIVELMNFVVLNDIHLDESRKVR
jgi:hypothetical protein